MSRRSVSLLATGIMLAAALAVIPGLAGARPKSSVKSHAVSLTVNFDAVTSTSSVGTAGDVDRDAGIVTGTIGGKSIGTGAAIQKVTWGSALRFKSVGTRFDAKGSTSFTGSGQSTVSGTTVTFTGKLKVSGGTGAYKGATGTLDVTGTAPLGSDTDAATATVTGKLKY